MTVATEEAITALGSWVRAIRRALDAAGCDGRTLLVRAGVDLKELENPDARLPIETISRLWKLAIHTTGDPGFGIHVASHITPTTFHALGYSLCASGTLKEAYERIVRYYRVISDALDYAFLRQGEHYVFVLEPRVCRGQRVADEAIDAIVAAHVRMSRSLLGRDYVPVRIELRRERPAQMGSFQTLLRAPVVFAADRNCIVFDRASLERPLEGANPELARHNDEIAQQHLARVDRGNIRSRVRSVLVAQLQHGEPSQEQIAELLNVSPRTLQRKLGECGTSYKELLDETRRELALTYLRGARHSVTEVTYLLGFSASSSFTRAFRRWTGSSPSDWRAQGEERPPEAA